jgi:hypothetical protein
LKKRCRVTRTSRWLLVLTAIAAIATGVVRTADHTANGASTSRLSKVTVHEDSFWNYDFTTNRVHANRVDWPIGLVFFGNATINKVKDILGNEYDRSGSAMWGRINDGPRWRWDTDKGRKTTACPGLPTQPSWARHYRVYADGDDRLYNPSWGFYVIGSTHYDVRECAVSGKQFGWSESAEDWVVWRWSVNGYWAQNDWTGISNHEPLRVEGNHVWSNNGRASRLHTP